MKPEANSDFLPLALIQPAKRGVDISLSPNHAGPSSFLLVEVKIVIYLKKSTSLRGNHHLISLHSQQHCRSHRPLKNIVKQIEKYMMNYVRDNNGKSLNMNDF